MTSLFLSSTDSSSLSVPAALTCACDLSDSALLHSAHSKTSRADKKSGASEKISKNILTGGHGADLTLKIFSFLDAKNLCLVAVVANYCHRISQNHLLWNLPQGIKRFRSKTLTPKIRWFILNPEYKTDCVSISNSSKERVKLSQKVVHSSNWQKIKSKTFFNQLILSISAIASIRLQSSLSGEDQSFSFGEDNANPLPFFLTFFSFSMATFFNFSSKSDHLSPLLIAQKCSALKQEIGKKSADNLARDRDRLVIKKDHLFKIH